MTNADLPDDQGKVKLMTIHAAKGLEFPYVFVVGMNEGIFPSRRVQNMEQLEEERRLAYVAFTRAKDELYLTDSEGVDKHGGFRCPSRFIFNAGKENLEYVVPLSDELIQQSDAIISALEARVAGAAYAVGERVTHRAFGAGTITAVSTGDMAYTIKFDDIITPRGISFDVASRVLTKV
jgi:DNA helicase-2/ATP-dependent DNA helicase PcrA